jgi:two-component system sensor histidine kinase DesK
VTEIVLVPRLWATFATAWLLVLAITMAQLARAPIAPWRLAAMLSDLVLLAFLYLWLTLRACAVGSDSQSRTNQARRMALLLGMSLLLVPPVFLVPSAGMWWLVTYVIVGAGLALPPIGASVVVLVLLALAMLVAWIVAGQVEFRLLIQIAIGGAAMAVRQLVLTVEQLRVAREELASRAVDEERLRIARDLHDLLGHSLSLVALKSELAGRLVITNPAAAAGEIRDIESAVRHALAHVRNAVTGYRQPTLRGEVAAARELLAASGIRASIVDRVGPLPTAVDTLFAWTIREAVTNVIRHSRARECVVRTDRDDRAVRVSITDNGSGSGTLEARSEGSGLTGLRERASTYDGTLISAPLASGGFQLLLEIPVQQLVHAGAASE